MQEHPLRLRVATQNVYERTANPRGMNALLKEQALSVEQIARQCRFASAKYFRTINQKNASHILYNAHKSIHCYT